ncbi:MAG: hypothetical protein ACK4M2_00500 [Brevundimonas sp.]
MNSDSAKEPATIPNPQAGAFDEALDRELDKALADSFPASDPVSIDRREDPL